MTASARRAIDWLLAAIVTALFLAVFAGLLRWMLWVPDFHHRTPPPQPTHAEHLAFKKLIAYHGLQDGMTIIHGWPDNPYFYRNGKKCAFRAIPKAKRPAKKARRDQARAEATGRS